MFGGVSAWEDSLGVSAQGGLPRGMSAWGRCISEFNVVDSPLPLMDRIFYTLLLRTVKSTTPNLRHTDLAFEVFVNNTNPTFLAFLYKISIEVS